MVDWIRFLLFMGIVIGSRRNKILFVITWSCMTYYFLSAWTLLEFQSSNVLSSCILRFDCFFMIRDEFEIKHSLGSASSKNCLQKCGSWANIYRYSKICLQNKYVLRTKIIDWHKHDIGWTRLEKRKKWVKIYFLFMLTADMAIII